MAQGYCSAVYSCTCDTYPYPTPNDCFAELLGAYDELNDAAYLSGLIYDGTCPAAELSAIESLACSGAVPEPPAGVCVPPCKAWHGNLGAGFVCEPLATSAELGIAFSACAQGLVCTSGVCVNPCQSAGTLPGIGQPCPELVCAPGAICDDTSTCIAEPVLPGPGAACVMGMCDPKTAICVAAASVCAALPTTGQACIEGQCDATSYCGADNECLARPPLACGLLGADVPGDGDGDPGDGDTDTGDGDGDTDTGDGDGDGDAALSHAVDIQPIWADNCALSSCHAPGGTAEFLDLSVDGYSALVGTPSAQAVGASLVEAGNSANSYLIAKLRGQQAEFGGMGNSMPAGNGASPLPEVTIMLIEEWIDAGALP
ncbi:hypothetical protein [Enhygromyxa salina]|nr:hypothetical protein [Enhygromyxa salina]